MAPNGYDHGDTDEQPMQPRTFREVMTEALEMMGVGIAQLGFGGMGTETIDIQELAKNLRHSTGIPEKAKPFVEKFNEITSKLNGLGASLEPESPDQQTMQDKIDKLEQLLMELAETSKINSSLEKLSGYISDEVRVFLLMIKEVLGQSQGIDRLTSGLDDLFENDK